MHWVYIRNSIIYCLRQHDVLERECVRVKKLREDFPSPLFSRDTCGLLEVAHKSDHLTAFLYLRTYTPGLGLMHPPSLLLETRLIFSSNHEGLP